MKTYIMQRPPDPGHVGDCRATVTKPGQQPAPLRHVKFHSDGLEWGYAGSGPADLALSILADHFNERPTIRQLAHGACRAWPLHQAFKFAFIAPADRAGFQITQAEIAAWVHVQLIDQEETPP